jgi:exodeoxyribonuclease VII large subunit
MTAALRQLLLQRDNQLTALRSNLLQLSPALSIQRSIGRLTASRQRLAEAVRKAVAASKHRTALLGRALHAVSPLATLDRGYAIVTNEATGRVLRNAGDAKSGDAIRTQLASGSLSARVTQINDDGQFD